MTKQGDRNFRREQWLTLLITMFCYLFFYTGRHNFGWAAHQMAADLKINYELVGWISFSMLIGYALGQLINGNLADRYNPRVMIAAGGILSVLCNFAISFSSSYGTILTLWALNGYFQSLAWAPGSRIISNWWGRNEKGKAFGFYTMAAGSSSAVTFLISVLIIQQDTEWNMLFRVPVLFLLVAVIIFYLVVRSKPSDKGYPDIHHENANPGHTNWKERYAAVLKNRKFIVASAALGFESMARYGLIVWVPVHFLGARETTTNDHLWTTVLMPIGMAFGAVSFGHISDALFAGNRPASIRLGMLLAACMAILIYFTSVTDPIVAGVFMFLAGFFVYGPQANFWPLSPEMLGERYVGTGIGVMNMCAYLFAALGEPLLGKVIDLTNETSSVFLVIAGICCLSALTISFAGGQSKLST